MRSARRTTRRSCATRKPAARAAPWTRTASGSLATRSASPYRVSRRARAAVGAEAAGALTLPTVQRRERVWGQLAPGGKLLPEVHHCQRLVRQRQAGLQEPQRRSGLPDHAEEGGLCAEGAPHRQPDGKEPNVKPVRTREMVASLHFVVVSVTAALVGDVVLVSAGELLFDFFVFPGPASVTQISHLRRLNSELRRLICSIRADPLRSGPAQTSADAWMEATCTA